MIEKTTRTARKILGTTYDVVRSSDGIQRAEWLYYAGAPTDSDGLGVISTGRWAEWVIARAPDGTTKKLIAMKYCLTKDQAFRELHRWLAAKAQGLLEVGEVA
jgi:hypothetical protein